MVMLDAADLTWDDPMMRHCPALPALPSLALATLAMALLAAPAAQAQDQPRLEPTRDVAVTYRLVGAGAQGQVAMSWRASARQARLDNPDGSFLVADLAAGSGFMAHDQARELMVLPAPPTDAGVPGLVPPGGRFVRDGADKVAGQDCQGWRVEMSDGGRGRACITADGVVLRSVGAGGPGQPEQGLEATAVAYAPQSPARFARPAGYREVAAPPPPGAPQR
jgi:hypothetical protein